MATLYVMNKGSLLLLLLLLLPMIGHTQESDTITDDGFSVWLWDYLTVGASVTVGLGGRSVVVDVTRQDTGDHGKLIDNKEEAYFIYYSTRAGYIGVSNVGYSWILNLSSINLTQQELASGEARDLGTRVNGYFATTVPTLFYNIGDRYQGHYLRAGVGVGVGIAKFEGDIILTESSRSNDRVTISNGTSNIFFAYGVFVDYQWQNFSISLTHSGPNLRYNEYDINVSGTSLVLGYTFYL